MSTNQPDICIVGGGLSGLATARCLLEAQPDVQVLVLEKAGQPGGTIATFSTDGYQAEWGAHGFLDNCDESRRLVSLAGLDKEVQTAPLKTFVRYVCVNGRLVCVPQNPLKALTAPLMPLHAKIGVLRDLFKKPLDGDPSVAEWSTYRFGKAMLPLADAVYTGTYAGDIQRLKIDAVMPGVRAMERQHGSVIRGAVHRLRQARRDKGRQRRGFPSMTSFQRGMGRLPAALAEILEQRDSLRYQAAVQSIEPDSAGGWQVRTEAGQLTCRQLVLAVPVNTSLTLLTGLPDMPPPPLLSVPEAPLATVVLGFTEAAGIPFGFGYLAPETEGRFALGTLFSSHMFPGRAPPDRQLVETLVGGRRHPERLQLDDQELIRRSYEDIRELMPLPEPPCFARVLRPPAGIPQLEAGHTELLAWRDQAQARHPTLHICGFGWIGIGINDMIKEACQVAERLGGSEPGTENERVRGVYV